MDGCRERCAWSARRRTILCVGLALAPWLAGAAKAADPPEMPPQHGDRFAWLTGDKQGQVIKADDLALGGPQVQAYPIDVKSGVIRSGSRLNLILLARFDPAALSEETRARSASGIVAYSGVCTHQGCPVNMWSSDNAALYCSCHGSMYNPKDGAEVVGGPAPRPLPSLALGIEDGVPFVADGFSARVGPEQH